MTGWVLPKRDRGWLRPCAKDYAGEHHGGHSEGRHREQLPVTFALREFIANALDEQALSQSEPIEITEVSEGVWCIRDFGRGLSYLHLTQKENPEKTKHPEVIGRFGIGLKDALAVCDRRQVGVVIRSRHGNITTAQLPKADFADVVTLHGVVSAPSAPTMAGTEVVVSGVSEQDVATAKTFFLRFSGDHLLEETKRGQVLQRAGEKSPGRIYVKGLLVAEEPNFLVSMYSGRPSTSVFGRNLGLTSVLTALVR